MRQNSRNNHAKREVKKGNGAIAGASKIGNKNRKKFKGTRLFKLLRLALVIIIVLFVFNIIKDFTNKSPDKISVIIGDKKIDLIHELTIDKNNNISMSIDDVKKLYDNNIYYSNNILITTYNKHIAVLEVGKSTMKVNDVVQEIKGTLKETNGTIYLPFSDMGDVYDFENNYNKDTKVLSLDSKSKEKKESIVLKNTSLKETPNTFATKLEKIKKTQYVTVFGTEGDWTKVRSKAGNIGYIPTKKLSKPEILWENMDEEELKDIKILNEYSIVDSKYEVLSNSSDNSVVMPNLFNIIQNSEEKIEVENIIDLEGKKFTAYKEWANESKVEICPTVTLECSMSKVCASYESRAYVINTLYNDLVSNNLKMICIDFSNIDDSEGLYRFVTEMVPRFKCAGMKVLIKYNSSLNKDRLKNIVDYVVE